MSFDYKHTKCSICHKEVECVSVWSNIIPWLCESCCETEGEPWTEEQLEEDEE